MDNFLIIKTYNNLIAMTILRLIKSCREYKFKMKSKILYQKCCINQK